MTKNRLRCFPSLSKKLGLGLWLTAVAGFFLFIFWTPVFTWAQISPPEPQGLPVESVDSNPSSPGTVMIDLLEVKNTDILEVLNIISSKTGLNIVATQEVKGKATIYLKEINVYDALRIILEANDLAYEVSSEGGIDVMTAQQYEAKWGYPFTQKVKTKIISLHHSKPKDILDVLEQMKSPSGKIMADDAKDTLILIDTPDQLHPMVTYIKEWDVPLEEKTFVLKFIQAQETAKAIEPALTRDVGRLEYDVTLNQIKVADKPQKMKEIASLIQKMDQENKEIIIEAKVLQIVLNEEYLQGVDWEAIVSDYQKVNFSRGGNLADGQGKSSGTIFQLSLGIISEEDYTVLLEALETVGDINVISNLKESTVNHKACDIIVKTALEGQMASPEDKEPIRRKSAEEINQSSNAILKTEEALKLHLLPQLDEKDGLSLRIGPEIMAAFLAKGDETEHSNEYLLKIQPGETAVVGGVFKSVWVESRSKIPLLGDLPLVGFAFRHEGRHERKAEIIIFLTPKILVKNEPKAG